MQPWQERSDARQLMHVSDLFITSRHGLFHGGTMDSRICMLYCLGHHEPRVVWPNLMQQVVPLSNCLVVNLNLCMSKCSDHKRIQLLVATNDTKQSLLSVSTRTQYNAPTLESSTYKGQLSHTRQLKSACIHSCYKHHIKLTQLCYAQTVYCSASTQMQMWAIHEEANHLNCFRYHSGAKYLTNYSAVFTACFHYF
jgi:hypothetical protein